MGRSPEQLSRRAVLRGAARGGLVVLGLLSDGIGAQFVGTALGEQRDGDAQQRRGINEIGTRDQLARREISQGKATLDQVLPDVGTGAGYLSLGSASVYFGLKPFFEDIT